MFFKRQLVCIKVNWMNLWSIVYFEIFSTFICTYRINVLNNLKRGANSVTLHITGARWLIFPQEVTVNISLDLEYTGEEPEIIPPGELLLKYLPWIVGGSLGVVILILIVR